MSTALSALRAFRRHGMTDHAAALTYYLTMSLFPGMLVGVSLFGLFAAPDTVLDATSYLRRAGAPPSVVDAVHDALADLVRSSSGKAGVALVIGLLLGLNSASGAFAAAGRALNAVAEVREDRAFLRRKVADVGVTLVVVLLGLVGLGGVLLGGQVTHDLLGAIGLGGAAGAFSVVRFPIAVLAMLLAYGAVYRYAPDCEERPGWISSGAVAAVVLWLATSLGFFAYVSHFGSYGATYGTFAGAIVMLLWLYLASLAFLLGGELNAARRRPPAGAAPAPPATSTAPRAPDR
ncbi:MAG TPA: YihY/virulence factor BrkB family protein [Solirubrobacteraceae bacterium]|jgi:membrane protein|nr:YihY/virulence factor BrkB family protein [Solirubrobacteraceae bacterium]